MTTRNFEDKYVQAADSAFVDDSAVVIGDVHLAEDVSIWPLTVARGDIQSITIGARTNIQDGCILHVTHAGEFSTDGHALQIGDDVTVGHGVVLHGCTIGNRCLIGMRAVIMDGVTVPDETIVGAGSLVAPGKTLESGYLWLGQPARRIRKITDKEREYLIYSAKHYVDLKNRHSQRKS